MAKIGYSIDYKDFDKFTKEVSASISEGKWKRFLKEAAQIAYKRAMRLCPVDTGWMQGQMYVEEMAGLGFTLGNDAEYASHHEYGWVAQKRGGDPENPRKYKGGYRPFIRPSVLSGQKHFEKKLDKWLEKMFKYGR